MSLEPEFRRDPICGRWAVVAPERMFRPITLQGAEPRHRTNGERKPCPFCVGQEQETPHEVLAYREPGTAPDGPGWRLRSVPNRYPPVRSDVENSVCTIGSALFRIAPGFGKSEVIIETPDHISDPTKLPDEQFGLVFRAYRDRLVAFADDDQFAAVAIFKNVGAEAGASLGHSHSQLVAIPVVPELIAAELTSAEAYWNRTRRCAFCALISRELADGVRVVAQSENFVVLAAFAPRFAHELWVVPRMHGSRYESITDEMCAELARLTKRVLIALDLAQSEPAYNWYLHTSPLRSPELPHYHWHLEILPRTARPAGLEWGFGCFITTVFPEAAAAELRESLPPLEPPSAGS